MNKVMLITGSNKGIGFEIARQCGKLGFNVIISGRDEKRINDALIKLKKENLSADFLIMDVSSIESIKNAVRLFTSRNLKIDVLVNNAGIIVGGDKGLLRSGEHLLEETINTNSLGPYHVTRYFLQFMQSPGRIIMVSSTAGSISNNVSGYSPAYSVSKTFLNAITRQFAFELRGKNISVNAVSPGWVRTDMGGSAAPRSIEKGAETPVWLATEISQNITGKFFSDKAEIPW